MSDACEKPAGGSPNRRFTNVDDYIADLKAKLAENPDCGHHLYNLGVALLSKREFLEAETAFRDAVDKSPSIAEAYVQLGGIAMWRGDIEGCLNYNRLATKTRPMFAVPHGNIGFCLLQMGKSTEAAKSLERAVKLDPKFVQALASLGGAYLAEGDPERCISVCERALAVEPMFGPAWNNLALAHLDLGKPEEAVRYVKKAQETGFEVNENVLKEVEPFWGGPS